MVVQFELPTDSIWQECLDLCFDAVSAGSMGIAAVVTDQLGNIITRGRNQLHDSLDSPNTISNNIVAHAELNALASLQDDHRWDHSLMLFTTVEPCPMCMGAISMSPVRHVVVGSRDKYAGAANWADTQPFIKRKRITVEYDDSHWETLFAALHAYSLMQRRKVPRTHPFYQAFETQYPGLLTAVKELDRNPRTKEAIAAKDQGWVRRALPH